MIYHDRKNRNRFLSLIARNAAKGFALRGAIARVRRDGWRPLVLRWRKRSRLRETVAPVRAAAKTTIRWFPHFHFHFATFTGSRDRQKALLAIPPAAGIHENRIVLEHRRPNNSTANPTVETLRVDRALSRAATEVNSLPKKSAERATPPRILWRSAARQIVTPRLRHVRRPLFGEKSQHGRPEKQEGASRSFRTHSRIQQHWRQVFSPRLSYPRTDRSPRAPQQEGLKFQIERFEELVWRRTSRSTKTIDDFEQPSTVSDSSRLAPVHSFSPQVTEQKVASAIEKAAPVQLTTLDPGVLDRLTDDVIRRVEQRIRIERERRGL